MVGKLLSFCDGLFSGTMLNLEGVDIMLYIRIPFSKMPGHLVKLTSPNNDTFLQETAAGWPVDTPLVQILDPGEKMWPKMFQKKTGRLCRNCFWNFIRNFRNLTIFFWLSPIIGNHDYQKYAWLLSTSISCKQKIIREPLFTTSTKSTIICSTTLIKHMSIAIHRAVFRGWAEFYLPASLGSVRWFGGA